MKNEIVKEQLVNLYMQAEKSVNEFGFFKINNYYMGVLEYIEKLENELEKIDSINQTRELMRGQAV